VKTSNILELNKTKNPLKKSATAVALTLILTMTFLVASIPVGAQTTIATIPYLSVSPKTIGIGQ